jgi:hypothetical protein
MNPKTLLGWFVPLVLLSMVVIACVLHDQAGVVEIPGTRIDAQAPEISRRPTRIKIQYPTPNLSTTKKEIGVVAVVDSGVSLDSVSVFVNDQQVKRFDIKGARKNAPVETPVTLNMGDNHIRIVALTDTGKSIHKKTVVKRIKPLEMSSGKMIGKRWAVVIGISDYLYASKGITPLRFAHRDAHEFMTFIQSAQGGGFPAANTRLLLNEQATTRNIRSTLFTFLKQAKADDLVLIYIASHGAPEPGRPDNLYLITYDTDPDDLASTAFPMWDMETALTRYILAERVVVLADACHSAGVGGEAGLRSVGNSNLINTYLANLQKTKTGRAIITASEANELSREGEEWGGHGVFTHYLLQGLKGEADSDQNGIITIVEAFNYVYYKVRRATDSQQHPNIQGQFDRNLPLAVAR